MAVPQIPRINVYGSKEGVICFNEDDTGMWNITRNDDSSTSSSPITEVAHQVFRQEQIENTPRLSLTTHHRRPISICNEVVIIVMFAVA